MARQGLRSVLIACWLAACGSSSSPTSADPATTADAGLDPADASRADAPPVDLAMPSCGSAGMVIPTGAVELAWDTGNALSHVRANDWTITVEQEEYHLDQEPIYEAVRFEIAHPGRVVGIAVQWANLAGALPPERELPLGLYPDFGRNGFDFWAGDPLWQGTRCVEDHVEGQWLHYALPQPVTVEPGLVFVAQHSAGAGEPSFAFAQGASTECQNYEACHSAINLPEATVYHNGISMSFPNDFLVRLYVEYTEQANAAELVFSEVPSSPTGKNISWGDYDNDGWDDALIGGRLHHNDQGVLVDVHDAAGLGALSFIPKGGVWGDYDNDGCLDLFAYVNSMTEADALLRSNCDGTFSDATAAAGIVDQQSANPCGDAEHNIRSPTVAAAWLDLDADGWLDLYLANYWCGATRTSYVDTVLRNRGDGTFVQLSAQDGFPASATPSRALAPADFNGDGQTDLFVGNYRLIANWLFENNGDGTVSERAAVLGAAGMPDRVGATAYYGHTIGAAWGDIDGDTDLDLVLANLAHPRFFGFSDKTQLLINNGAAGFSDLGAPWTPFSDSGLRYRETHSVPVLGDIDQDGALDLAITAVYEGRPTDFYWGNGDGTFAFDAYHAGITTTDGWGAAVADVDRDGDLDLFATTLFRNQLAAEQKGHWLQVRALGSTDGAGANWAAIGATVALQVGGRTLIRHVQGGTGQGGQDSLYLHFGLGDATSVDRIEVTYPGNHLVGFDGPFAVDQRIWVRQDGTTTTGWTP